MSGSLEGERGARADQERRHYAYPTAPCLALTREARRRGRLPTAITAVCRAAPTQRRTAAVVSQPVWDPRARALALSAFDEREVASLICDKVRKAAGWSAARRRMRHVMGHATLLTVGHAPHVAH